ncbi:hypothetical protein B0H13DRAFT_1919070 [Mycena leptocephala]|nr:hypothetical protein B0H13DRAFT_1919070 [Mycena leptocephala]
MPLISSDLERARMDLDLHQIPAHERRNKIQLGSMTNEDFRWWILGEACQSIQEATVTDVTWWAERHTVLKHQFILLRFEHADYGGLTTAYEVRMERAGKVIFSRHSQAIDKATVSVRPSSADPSFFDNYKLLFALLNHRVLVPPPSPGHVTDERPDPLFIEGYDRFTPPEALKHKENEREETFHYNAFVDFLDQKWRGPAPRLLDHTNYSLTSANCFWYSRLLFHAIALRHYSFPILATSTEAWKYVIPRTADNLKYGTGRVTEARWRTHDPSSISLLFRYLHYEEWRNGILMYRRLVMIQASLLFLATTPAVGYGLYRFHILLLKDTTASKATQMADSVLVLPLIGLDGRFTAPWAARGDYIPAPVPLVRARVADTRTAAGKNAIIVAYKPRDIPLPWENEPQIFAEKRQDYEAALQRLRKKEIGRRVNLIQMLGCNFLLRQKLNFSIEMSDETRSTLRLPEMPEGNGFNTLSTLERTSETGMGNYGRNMILRVVAAIQLGEVEEKPESRTDRF